MRRTLFFSPSLREPQRIAMLKTFALACVSLALSVGIATAGPRCGQKGPIRQAIHDARPGILIPKQAVSSSCSAPTVTHSPVVQFASGQAVTASSCSGGRCPLPR